MEQVSDTFENSQDLSLPIYRIGPAAAQSALEMSWQHTLLSQRRPHRQQSVEAEDRGRGCLEAGSPGVRLSRFGGVSIPLPAVGEPAQEGRLFAGCP